MTNNIRAILVAGLAKALGVKIDFALATPMPKNLFLLRHGESVGNVAVKKSKNNDDSDFTDDFMSRHSKTWHLTEKGIWQAKQARSWLIENNLARFDHYYVSPYYRAIQTAAHLDLPNARWHRPKITLRERDRGILDLTSVQVRLREFPEVDIAEQQEAYLYRFPGGESLADAELRARHFCTTLEREASGEDVIIVNHGDMMRAFQKLFEGFSLEEFMRLNNSESELDRIHNCQILQYSRVDHVTGKLHDYLVSKRSICPWDLKRSKNEWEYIVRQKLSNEDLFNMVQIEMAK